MSELQALIAQSKASYAAMSPAEKQQMHRDQRESFARAEAAFGNDDEEAEHRAAWASGDPARIAKSAEAEAVRLARFDEIKGEKK